MHKTIKTYLNEDQFDGQNVLKEVYNETMRAMDKLYDAIQRHGLYEEDEDYQEFKKAYFIINGLFQHTEGHGNQKNVG